jgi:UDP-GlcNAc3NAcA epimerase
MTKRVNITTIVGARPQFIKAAMVSRAFVQYNRENEDYHFVESLIHTGQHYDHNMSDIFFKQMGIPEPMVNLNAGSGLHGEMTGRMLAMIEKELMELKPDWLLVYGDTNSTLAGALAAAKLHIPVAHVEAGLRSFNKQMPEEINRILTDHVSSMLFCPTYTAMQNLQSENITRGVHHAGDVMYDAAKVFSDISSETSTVFRDQGLKSGGYLLSTLHRAENTDNPERLRSILNAFVRLAEKEPVVLPLHPRTAKSVRDLGFEKLLEPLRILPPVSFLDMVLLEKHARRILTDSGGVQKEAYFHGVPCVTLRHETEWIETVRAGWNTVAGTETGSILSAVAESKPGETIAEYGDGVASFRIVEFLSKRL